MHVLALTRRRGRPSRWLPRLLAPVALAAALLPATAVANDRPFQIARTAVAEEDDDQTWSFESWVQRFGGTRGVSVEPEYSFSPRTSVQAELTRLVDRSARETGQEAEVEFKHLFGRVDSDGWGWGVSAALGTEHIHAERRDVTSLGLKLPVSLPMWDDRGFFHLDLGIAKSSDARRTFGRAIAVEREVAARTLLFGEFSRDGDTRFVQLGARHWLRRDHLALDFSLQQYKSDGQRASGFVLGLGWYDI